MKLKKCPICESDNLGRHWCRGRKLAQYCHDCNWKGAPQTPEQKEVEATKSICANHFPGFHFEIFDRYGHCMVSSQSFFDTADAKKEIKRHLENGKKDENAGPYTAVLWPDKVKVKGKIIR